MSLPPIQKAPPAPMPQTVTPDQTPVQPSAKNDGDGDDRGGGVVRASVEKGVGDLLDKSA